MPLIRQAVYGKGLCELSNLNQHERNLLEAITGRQRRKFRRRGIVPAAVIHVLKDWGLVPNEVLGRGEGMQVERLLDYIREAGGEDIDSAAFWLWLDTIRSELQISAAGKKRGRVKEKI